MHADTAPETLFWLTGGAINLNHSCKTQNSVTLPCMTLSALLLFQRIPISRQLFFTIMVTVSMAETGKITTMMRVMKVTTDLLLSEVLTFPGPWRSHYSRDFFFNVCVSVCLRRKRASERRRGADPEVEKERGTDRERERHKEEESWDGFRTEVRLLFERKVTMRMTCACHQWLGLTLMQICSKSTPEPTVAWDPFQYALPTISVARRH